MQHLSSKEKFLNIDDEDETAKGSVDLPSDVGISTMTDSKIFEYEDTNFSDFETTRTSPTLRLGNYGCL